ncbi:MAG: hypothetical protein IPK82_25600 [Polyangiaceae bacterium]|nr:hypothetical protein [Polyangiaceae bacterium]
MLRLTIVWNHADSAVLSNDNLTVGLFAPGERRPMTAASQRPGSAVFDLDDALNGQTVTLRAQVIYNTGGVAGNTQGTMPVSVEQGFQINPQSPRLTYNNTTGRWVGRRHPRVVIENQTAPDEAHRDREAATARVRLNLDFLDVTNCITATAPTSDYERTLWHVREQSRSHGNRLRILRHAGGSPHLWAAYVSSHVRSNATSVGVLVFFTPTHPDANVEVATANHQTPLRYLSNRQPTYSVGYTQHGRWRQPDGTIMEGWNLGWTPDCRYMDQIEFSRKPLVLLIPYYSGGRFGNASSQQLIQMVRSALTCLVAGGPVERDTPGPDGEHEQTVTFLGQTSSGSAVGISRLAVAGFSRGGKFATDAWQANKGSVSEVYLMDPATGGYSVTNYTGEFSSWLQGQNRDRRGVVSSGERLRLLGGDYLDQCRQVASGVSGNVEVRPASEDFFYTSNDYRTMFATNTTEAATNRPTLQLLSDLGSPISPLSARTGIQIHRAHSTGRQLAIVAPGIAGQPWALVPNHSEAELATFVGFARGWFLNGRNDGLATRSQFMQLVSNVSNEQDREHPNAVGAPGGYPRRHQWPAFGGETINGSFTGYLRFCLQTSGF